MSPDTADYARLKAEFLALIDLDEAARRERLARLDDEAPELAGALRRQLDAAGRALPLLDRREPAGEPRLPGYTILRELGRGGMGVVWLAERRIDDARVLVALKQVGHSRWNDDDRRRFQRERRILASLDHANIATLVDGGSDADGVAWLATAFIDGERIDRWCDAHALDVRRRVVLLRQVAAAVAHAHGRLVVHRDLKPANILVTADGVAKLLDFGIARALQEDAVTSDGPSQMTLRYAAPEQVASEGDEAGVSVDVYALGVLMYELLAKASPYGDARGHQALIRAILELEPAPPSASTSAIAGVDGDLDAICLKALRKSPAQRYASVGRLLADLDHWLDREPVDARRGERGYRVRRFLRRRWPLLAAAALALVAVGYHLQQREAQLAAAEQQRALAERQRDKAQALADHFGSLFRDARPAATESGEISARELLEASVATLRGDDERPPATRAALLLANADALNHLGRIEEAATAAQLALDLARALQPVDADLLAAAFSEVAGLKAKRGDNAGARADAAAGLALFADGAALDRSRLRTLQQQAAMFAEEAGDRDGARAVYLMIVEESRAGLDDDETLRHFIAAQANLATGETATDPATAATRLREAIDAAERHDFDEPGMLLPARVYLATALLNLERIDEAGVLLEPTLAQAREYYAADDPWLGVVLNSAGAWCLMSGQHARAEALFRESGAIYAAVAGPDHPNVRAAQSDLATVSVAAGDWPEARRRLAGIVGWLEANERGDTPMAQFLRAAQRYVDVRLHDDAATRAALRAALAAHAEWRPRYRWFARQWQAWLDEETKTPAP